MESPYFSPAGRDNAGPAKQSSRQEMCEWTRKRGSDPYWKEQGFVLTCVGHADGAVKLDA